MDLAQENRNDPENGEKQARLRGVLERMKRTNPSTFNQALKEETPELRNTAINPRLLSQPINTPIRSATPEPQAMTLPVTATPQERREIAVEKARAASAQNSHQMENLRRIIKNTTVHPSIRKEQEEYQRQLQLLQQQKKKDNDFYYLIGVVGVFFAYHYLKSKVGAI